MIFVDANVFIYAVGRSHALKRSALQFLEEAERATEPLCTSAEVIQELCHVYMSTNRLQDLDDALRLVNGVGLVVWPLQVEDVVRARELYDQFPMLTARDLCHLAVCQRVGATAMKTFDSNLEQVATSLLR